MECEFCWENDNPALPRAWEDFDFSLKPQPLESTGTEVVVANFDFDFKVYGGFIFGGRPSPAAGAADDDNTGAATSSVDVSVSLSISILFDLRQQSLEDLLMGISEKSSLLALRFRPTVCC